MLMLENQCIPLSPKLPSDKKRQQSYCFIGTHVGVPIVRHHCSSESMLCQSSGLGKLPLVHECIASYIRFEYP
jgi:hypothetical protein